MISLLIEHEAGALSRVSGLFSARGYNIESLTVAPTEDASLSRMTIVTSGSDDIIEQITKQLNKLVNVLKIVELENDNAVARDHMLVKVRTDATTRSQVLEAVTLFRARVIDVVSDSVVIEVTGDSAKCQAFIKVLEPFGIKELVQSGAIAISRGSKSMSEKVLR